MSEFLDELLKDGTKAWRGYINKFQTSNYFHFRHVTFGQRTVHCKDCGVAISRDVPRLYISGSWSYMQGYYCLDCGKQALRANIIDKKHLFEELGENISALKNIEAIVERCKEKEAYKDKMSVPRLMAKVEGKKRRTYY